MLDARGAVSYLDRGLLNALGRRWNGRWVALDAPTGRLVGDRDPDQRDGQADQRRAGGDHDLHDGVPEWRAVAANLAGPPVRDELLARRVELGEVQFGLKK